MKGRFRKSNVLIEKPGMEGTPSSSQMKDEKIINGAAG
jgi:hypothetical protein